MFKNIAAKLETAFIVTFVGVMVAGFIALPFVAAGAILN